MAGESGGRVVRLGTRGSALARWQTDYIARLLQTAHPTLRVEIEVFTTKGDRLIDQPLPLIGGKGVFTAELESALRGGQIDFAVHSLKDLPTETPDDLSIGAIPQRVDAADVLVSRVGHTLATLPQGARIGTSSRRRSAQILHLRRDLTLTDLRGNVDTRLRKVLDPEGDYDAILLAHAGLERLGRLDSTTQRLTFDEMLPAPGQGALAVQCRTDPTLLELLEALHHPPSAAAVSAERAFLAGLGGGCSLPIGAYAEISGDDLRLRGRVTAVDGGQQVEVSISGRVDQAEALGYGLADQALARGAAALLEALE
ncbi:MAG: hydroxymethylbilane synthase [Chloroflexota bacterium]